MLKKIIMVGFILLPHSILFFVDKVNSILYKIPVEELREYYYKNI